MHSTGLELSDTGRAWYIPATSRQSRERVKVIYYTYYIL